MSVSEKDTESVITAVGLLAITRNSCLIDDFVSNLFFTVLDFQIDSAAVERAYEHYKTHMYEAVRTMTDLQQLLARYPDDFSGNTALADKLWGCDMWSRGKVLRGLVRFFDRVGVRDQEALRCWAKKANFQHDFEGRVRGLGLGVFNRLVMRQGVETVQPDVHIRRFAERAVGRELNDDDVVKVVAAAAQAVGVKAHVLDWTIRDYEWGGMRALRARESDLDDILADDPGQLLDPAGGPPDEALLGIAATAEERAELEQDH